MSKLSRCLREGKTVLDFSAYSYCKPCRNIKPVFEELKKDFPTMNFFVIETDLENEEFDKIASDFKIESVPTFLMIRDGKVVDKVVGANEKKLVDAVEKLEMM